MFLRSCALNPEFDWLIFTDDQRHFIYPANVRVVYCTFADIVALCRRKLRDNVPIDKPYKLTDFKAAYGMIFEDYIRPYEFWGYCDTDVVWGRMRDFITPDVLNNYDCIRNRGHLVLRRNTAVVNSLYQDQDPVLPYTYQIAFHTQVCCHFDENMEWLKVFDKKGLRYWGNPIAADICPEYYPFKLAEQPGHTDRSVFCWSEQGLQRYWIEDGQVRQDTWCYIHLQKRDMTVRCDLVTTAAVMIVPNYFCDAAKVKDMRQLLVQAAQDKVYFSWYKKWWRQFFHEKLHGSFLVNRRRKLDRILSKLSVHPGR